MRPAEIRGKSPERDRGGYPPSSYPPRGHSPSFNRGRSGYDNYPREDSRFARTAPPSRGAVELRDPRVERTESRLDSRDVGNRGDSRTDERSENFTGGQSSSVGGEKQRMRTP